jgi:chromosome segregation ATPase
VDPIEYRNLKQSADDLRKNLKTCQQKLDVSNKENGELKTSLTQKQTELADVQKELENERGRTSKLSEKMRDWKTKISDQQREKVELTTKNDELIKEMVSLKDTNQSLSEQSKEALRLMQEKDSQITMMQKQQLENEKERERKGSVVELTKKRKDMGGPEVIDEGGKDLEKSLKQQLKEKLKSKIIENTGNDAEVEEQPDIKKMKSSSTLVSRNSLLESVGPFGQSPLLSKSILNATASSFMPSDLSTSSSALGQLLKSTIPKGNTTTTTAKTSTKGKEEGEESE